MKHASDKTAPLNQHARFLEAAREACGDVDTDVADRLMGKLATMPPEPKPAKKEKKVVGEGIEPS